MATLGTAYVQIVPSAKGISGAIQSMISPGASEAGATGGKLLGSRLIAGAKALAVGAAVGAGMLKGIKGAVTEGAALEQSIGGIETLYKRSAGMMRKYADDAYRTAGVSANSYMSQVTSFSAGLIQALGGDTAAAGEVANQAMIDMADNMNKMGTPLQDIQNAYQGFAKQNYTMLDNLKLGYGGTKQEMERLLDDATKLTGVKYDISNLADVYNAIHAIQENIGITGTTALEAQTTVSGSFGAMKAAMQNAFGAMALGENVREAMMSLAETMKVFFFDNLLPMMGQMIASLPEAVMSFFATAGPLFLQAGGEILNQLFQGFLTGLPNFITQLQGFFSQFTSWLSTSFPSIILAGAELLAQMGTGFIQSLPLILELLGTVIMGILNAIVTAGPGILSAAVTAFKGLVEALISVAPDVILKLVDLLLELISKIAEKIPELQKVATDFFQKVLEGIRDTAPKVLEKMGRLLLALISKIVEKLPDMLRKGAELIAKLVSGMASRRGMVVSKAGEIIMALLSKLASFAGEMLAKGVELFTNFISGVAQKTGELLSTGANAVQNMLGRIRGFVGDFVTAGFNLLMGLATGIANAVSNVVSAAMAACRSVLNRVKGFFGIASPSKVFMEFGKFLDEGLALGIEKNLGVVDKAVGELEDTAMADIKGSVQYDIGTSDVFGDHSARNKERKDPSPKPAQITLVLGGRSFKAFVKDITSAQDEELDLELSY